MQEMRFHIIPAFCLSLDSLGDGRGVNINLIIGVIWGNCSKPQLPLTLCVFPPPPHLTSQVDAYGNILLTTLEMNNEVMPSDVGSSVSDSRNSVMSFDSSGVQFRKPMAPRDGFSHHSLDRSAMRSRANCRLRRRSSKLKLKIPNLSDVSTIDKWSRVIFPITFGFFNLIYWLYYVN